MWLIGFFIGLAVFAGIGGGSGWHIPIGGIIGAIIATALSSHIENLNEASRKEKEERERKQKEEKKAAETANQLKEIHKKQQLFVEKQYNAIKAKYPLGLSIFETINSFEDGKNSAGLTLEEIIGCESEISKLQQSAEESESFDVWEKDQRDFSYNCYEINKTVCPSWGRYTYEIPYNRSDSTGKPIIGKHKIWHFFSDSGCLDLSLDYTHFISYKKNGENYTNLQKALWTYKDYVYSKVNEFVEQLQDVLVIYRYDSNYAQTFYITPQNNFKKTNVENIIDVILGMPGASAYDNLIIPDTQKIVIFDMLTTNDELIDLCSLIFNKYESKRPLICYISLCKYFNTSEMQALIDHKNKEIQTLKEEKEKQLKAIDNCLSVVKDWESTRFNLPYKYLVDYYPNTCEFEATQFEWNNRWLVWNFKNTPDKTSEEDHLSAVDKVVERLSSLLFKTFGEENLKYFTLVCIPASSQEKTNLRYEDFSRMICSKTGLISSFYKIRVINDKVAKREGGTMINEDNLQFDEAFFKGKYVFLFDDVITSGESMNVVRKRLNQLGSTVLCGLAIGKTKHDASTRRLVPTIEDLYKKTY